MGGFAFLFLFFLLRLPESVERFTNSGVHAEQPADPESVELLNQWL